MRRFKAELDSLHAMMNYVHQEAEKAGFDDDGVKKIELATEEAVVNIISHGYKGFEGPIEIDFIRPSSVLVEIIIRDHGLPFNPLGKIHKVNHLDSVEDREPGGFGLVLIKKIMDKVEYVRKNDENILTLFKYITQSTS